jgi:hypothetical protein
MHHWKVAPIFLIVDYGGMSISTTRVRLIREMTSPDNRATTIFSTGFVDIYSQPYTVLTLLAFFLIAKNGGKTISAAKGRVRPELKSPFALLTPIWYRSVLEFFGYLLPVKSYSTFSICM